MARVWVAEQIALERRVAIKLLSAEIVESDVGRELFEREARATARVDHPHVVRVVDYATHDGIPFLVLELLSGETLEERIQRSGPLTLADVRTIITHTASALAFAHESGILHRDIKADNIFLVRRGSDAFDVKLLDFGVALQRARPMVHSTGIVGTPAYIAPEQLAGTELDERCDMFSLGVCAYYALTGRFPYCGDTIEEVARSLADGSYLPATRLRPDLPSAIDDWFARAIATNRDGRYARATQLVAALESALGASRETTLTAHAVSIPSLPVARRFSRRTTYVAGAALAGALTAAAMIVAHASLDSRGGAAAHAERAKTVASARSAPSVVPMSSASAVVAVAPVTAVRSATESTRAKRRVATAVDASAAAREERGSLVDASSEASADASSDELVIEGTEGFGNRQ